MPEIIAQLKAGRRTLSLGNMSPKRDYIHVKDVASGFAAAALRGKVPGKATVTVNLGTGRSYSVAEVLDKLRGVAGVAFEVQQDNARLRKVDRPFLAADIGLIREVFDWQPRHTIDDAVADLWRSPDLTHELAAKYQ